MVTSYSENIKNNMEELKEKNVKFLNPFMAFTSEEILSKKLQEVFKQEFDIPESETKKAAKKAWDELSQARSDVEKKGEEVLQYLKDTGKHGIVLAGRPYHIDPEINHGINDLITSFGFVLVTEDALSYLEGYAPRKVLNQWTFQSRMYNAARYVCTQPDMQVVQLVSFGCGTDAITTDELRNILEKGGKLYTQLKIDDISNLGAVKIRIRSLMAAMEARQAQDARG